MSTKSPLLVDSSAASPGLVATDLIDDLETTSVEESLNSVRHYGSIAIQKSEPSVSPTRLKIILGCLFVNVFLSALDSTIVATLLSIIASDLNALPYLSWIATSYLLACSAFQPLFGKISDIFGRKSITVFCALLFAFGCLFCGITNSFWVFAIGRFITGIGGGGFNTLSTITLSDLIETRQRGLYQGYMNIAFGMGTASGGVIAGIFQNFFGWRSAFLIQFPICILSGALVLLFLELPDGSPGRGVQGSSIWKKLKHMDFIGSILLVASLLFLMYAASSGGRDFPYSSKQFIIPVVLGTTQIIIFYFYELKVASQPVIPVQLLHNRTVLSSSLNCWFISMNVFSILYFVPLYWLVVKDLSSIDSGNRLLPSAVAISLGSVYAGYRIKKTGKYKNALLFYGALTTLGSILVYLLTPSSSALFEYLVLVPSRFGTGAVITVDLIAMISSVLPEEQALVTSIQYGFRSTGSTLGVAIASAIFQGFLLKDMKFNISHLEHIPDKYKSDPDKLQIIIEKALQSTSYIRSGCPEFAREAIISAYSSSTHMVFVFVVVTGLIATLCSYFIEENSLER
ncbi:hypothetical protein OGAPHI_000894 [Ogataea philodendri]|uniref:Major facilitator superfamily (MFS) profile domain-containing protein n=1 Tax=Ogataea philodendri TaxID=1378263 RepID=A0A9P8PFP3_9ASCO|nr:uncharacterized protein OGAPHI_000894 [Ogataea philodendri]KAH3670379.1 hypothetical protein OGAPHI_000894 [Ogataea philodendri]